MKKTEQTVHVIIPESEQAAFQAADDAYWANKAIQAEAEGYVSREEVSKFLKEMQTICPPNNEKSPD